MNRNEFLEIIEREALTKSPPSNAIKDRKNGNLGRIKLL